MLFSRSVRFRRLVPFPRFSIGIVSSILLGRRPVTAQAGISGTRWLRRNVTGLLRLARAGLGAAGLCFGLWLWFAGAIGLWFRLAGAIGLWLWLAGATGLWLWLDGATGLAGAGLDRAIGLAGVTCLLARLAGLLGAAVVFRHA